MLLPLLFLRWKGKTTRTIQRTTIVCPAMVMSGQRVRAQQPRPAVLLEVNNLSLHSVALQLRLRFLARRNSVTANVEQRRNSSALRPRQRRSLCYILGPEMSRLMSMMRALLLPAAALFVRVHFRLLLRSCPALPPG